MPYYRTHLSAGIVLSLTMIALLQFCSPHTMSLHDRLMYSSLCLLGSLAPDIDTSSRIQRLAFQAIIITIFIAFLVKKTTVIPLLLGILLLLHQIPHRGITHRPWFCFIMPAIPIICINQINHVPCIDMLPPYIFFTVGALSHIILDRALSKFKMLYRKKKISPRHRFFFKR